MTPSGDPGHPSCAEAAQASAEAAHAVAEAAHAEPAIEEFADGEIGSYHGGVDGWLLAVYAVLAAWGVYYLVTFWGGLGPGQAR